MTLKKTVVSVIIIFVLAFAGGCKKKVPVAAAPPPPQAPVVEPAKPSPPIIAEFAVEPSGIDRGQTAELRWQVRDATQIEINQGIGTVAASGHRQIGPGESTTYTLAAKGPGGEATANATLSVTLPPPPPPLPPPAAPPSKPTITERLTTEVGDAFFDYDKSDLREDARAALTKDASALKLILDDFPGSTVIIEGHCDERGSAEYNIALGDRRASSAMAFLSQLGVSSERLSKISYGKERPQCTDSNETCWQKNRRVHFVPGEEQKKSVASQAGESVR
jgi:peptidoglycan-associated lipoprotein